MSSPYYLSRISQTSTLKIKERNISTSMQNSILRRKKKGHESKLTSGIYLYLKTSGYIMECVYIYIYKYIYKYICMYLPICLRMYACVYLSPYICISISSIYAYMYLYIFVYIYPTHMFVYILYIHTGICIHVHILNSYWIHNTHLVTYVTISIHTDVGVYLGHLT